MDLWARPIRRFVGVQLALVAAALHFAWGLPRLVVYLGVGRMPDLRPPLFVLSALVVAAAAIALYRTDYERRAAAVLVAVMVAYLVGYAGWHVVGHPVLASGGGIRTAHHPDGPVASTIAHLRNDAYALVTALAEIGAVAALGSLLAGDETNR